MSSSNSFSLFDPSSHKSEKPVKKKDAPKKSPPLTPEALQKRRELLFKDPQIKEWIERIEGIHKEIDEKVAILLEKQGQSAASVHNYLNDPKNFTPKQWRMIKDGQDALEKTIGMALDPSMKKMKKTKELDKSASQRRGKTLGSRKNWMDMR